MAAGVRAAGVPISRRALLAAAGGIALGAGAGALWGSATPLARALATLASPEEARPLGTAAAGLFSRDGIGTLGDATVFFNKAGCDHFRPSAAALSATVPGVWGVDAQDRIVATLPVPASYERMVVPGQVSLTWPEGALSAGGELHPVTLTLSNLTLRDFARSPAYASVMRVVACEWYAQDGLYVVSGLILGDDDVVRVTAQMDCAIEIAGVPASDRFVFYLYDLDQPIEDVRFGDAFETVHLDVGSYLREDDATRWLLSGVYDAAETDRRFACSSLLSAGRPATFTWRGRSCGTALFGELAGIGASDGRKEVAELDRNRAVLAYLGATLRGTQFCVENTLVAGTGAAAFNGHFTACDGTSFYGELFEVRDHFGLVVERVGGVLGLAPWRFAGTFDDYEEPTHWHADGYNLIWDDEGNVVGWEPARWVPDAWRQYWAPSIDGPRRSPVRVREALVPGSAAEAVYGPALPAPITAGTLDAGHPIEYKPGHCDSREVADEDFGPFEWAFTGVHANRVTAARARLHYLVFCADGTWRELLYEGEDGGCARWESTDAMGSPIAFGGAPGGFAVGGVGQCLPAFSERFAYLAEMCPELGARVTPEGEWVLSAQAFELARGSGGVASPRTGPCGYLGGNTGMLGSDGFMGWHFTGNDPEPPPDEVLDGWPSHSPWGYGGERYDPPREPGLWHGAHLAGIAEEGLAHDEAPGGVRSSLTSVRLSEGDNYVWGVTHATLSHDYLAPGEHGSLDGLGREHGTGDHSNEIDYEAARACVYEQPASGETAPEARPHDIALPPALDVRVGRPLRYKPYLANAFTPLDYQAGVWDERWVRWRWQGWHDGARDGRMPALTSPLSIGGDRTIYTGWMQLDAEGVEATRIHNV